MKTLSALFLSFALGCASISLTGCGANFIPATLAGAPQSAVTGPPLGGSVFGGHAPLVGAKVYVLTPSTTGTGSAGASTSLMSSTSSTTGGYPVTKDTSGGVTNGMYYVTTDANGVFNITGDYTCTVNQPVYIAAVGGAPVFPSNTGAVTVTGVTEISTTGTGASQTGTLQFTAASTELFYVGELVTLTGFTGDLAYLNNSVQTVLANGLSTTQFEATLGTWNGSKDINANYTGLTGKATAIPPQNPAAINMAALGLCPPSGTFAGSISFIYMNEISTVALAYATAAFGSDAFHIGVKTGGPLDLAGPNGGAGYVSRSMGQAFANAYLLYDISGSDVSTTFAGEGHIARSITPGTFGVVPQALIDTIGNIMAACVDSANSSSTPSSQCTTLFSNATLNGSTTGTKPTDIATAAFNLAHYPAGFGNSSFVSNLFHLPQGNVPFTPNLSSAPNDFTIGIQFTVNSAANAGGTILSSPQILTIDGQVEVGNEYGLTSSANDNAIWIGSYGSQTAKFLTDGFPDYATNSVAAFTGANTTDARSVAIDNTGNVWIALEKLHQLKEFSNTGTLLLNVSTVQSLPSFEPVSAAIDASGNVFVDVQDNVIKFSSAGANIQAGGGNGNTYFGTGNSCLAPQATTPFTYTYENVLDSNGLYYTITTPSSQQSPAYLCVIDPVAATTKEQVSGFYAYVGNSAIPFMSVDGNQTVWSTDPINNKLLGYNYASQPTSIKYTFTGGGLNAPASTAVDGNGNIWVTNTGNSSLSEFSPTGTALTPTSGLGALGSNSPNSAGIAIDRAGNIWIAYSASSAYIVEEIGLAAPTVGPTAYATFNRLNGTRPY